MELEPAKKQRIIRNAFLSLFIFALPLLLMAGTFYITGERPWEKPQTKQVKTNTEKPKINSNEQD